MNISNCLLIFAWRLSCYQAVLSRRAANKTPVSPMAIKTASRPPIPAWLAPERDVGSAYTPTRISYDYWTKLYWATPPWLTEEMSMEMKALYESRQEGEHVDHIVPLKGDTVCGLHVPWNLQIITDKENYAKSNKYWPDMWQEQLELFAEEV